MVADMSLLSGQHPHFQPDGKTAFGAFTGPFPKAKGSSSQAQAKDMSFPPKIILSLDMRSVKKASVLIQRKFRK